MSTSRLPNGVTNAVKNGPLHNFIAPDPSRVHQFFDDFDNYLAAEWLVTEVGTGSRALADADGGQLVITNGAVDNNSNFLQWKGNDAAVVENFLFEAGKKLWFKARLKVSDATESDFVIGLQITDTTPLAVTDGVYFRKDDGDANLDFTALKNSAGQAAAAIHTVVDDTFLEVGFYYDGNTELSYFVDNVKLGTFTLGAGLPDDEELAVSFGIQNGEGVAKVMTIDYILAAKER